MQRKLWLAAGACALGLALTSGCATPPSAEADRRSELTIAPTPVADGFGFELKRDGVVVARRAAPLLLERMTAEGGAVHEGAYETLRTEGGVTVGRGAITADGVRFAFEDRWRIEDGALRLERTVSPDRAAPGGFATALPLDLAGAATIPEVKLFAPGVIYGGFDGLMDTALGGRASYTPGDTTLRIRDDRLAAPMIAAHYAGDGCLALIDPTPDSATTLEDAMQIEPAPLVSPELQFGALGASERPGAVSLTYWRPGSEGPITYGKGWPGKHIRKTRARFHPIDPTKPHAYDLAVVAAPAADLPSCQKAAWRAAFAALSPKVHVQPIETLRRDITDRLADSVLTFGDRMGPPNARDLEKPGAPVGHNDAVSMMGFTGKALESAEFLLVEADRRQGPEAERLRALATGTIATFLTLETDPPEGEGFDLATGKPLPAVRWQGPPFQLFLRSFGDDYKALLRAYRREAAQGRNHPEWLAKAQGFGDWLLTQQQPDGGFPRSWAPDGSGRVHNPSPNGSFNGIPLLVLLSEITGDGRYREAAIRAGDRLWAIGQADGRFVGGTIDNPDVLDKEAGTLSLESYLALHRVTGEARWLERAKAAADYAETWIYLWDVPMPPGADVAAIHWKPGVPTTGMQLISTGHSLTDAYMAFDVDEYAALYKATGDEHYLDVARLLLHNTKLIAATPDRPYDLPGPGWQQEHFSFAPPRGYGEHRLWLPWVATSQLNGIANLEDLDPALYRRLVAGD